LPGSAQLGDPVRISGLVPVGVLRVEFGGEIVDLFGGLLTELGEELFRVLQLLEPLREPFLPVPHRPAPVLVHRRSALPARPSDFDWSPPPARARPSRSSDTGRRTDAHF